LPTFFAGIGSLAGGVIVAHYAGFPKGEIVDYFNWIPRGWLPQTLGQFVAFSGSQLILIGLVLMAWNEKPLTWSKAAYFSFLSWVQLTLIFGVLPSEWLNLAQGPLEWTNQREFIKFPPMLFLGNEVSLSFGALKDIIQLGISQGALIAVFVIGYFIQDINNMKEKGKVKISDYGKKVVKTGANG
tara:strand:+ start:1660 stop:2214 length:555 start_codon:yes stop_codon:yes gene_type:complete